MKRKYLKVAVTPEVYTALTRAADQRGLTLATWVRTQLEQRQAPMAVEAMLTRIEAQLAQNAATKPATDQERLLTEIVLLVRELVSERNAQVLARVRQQLAAQFGAREHA